MDDVTQQRHGLPEWVIPPMEGRVYTETTGGTTVLLVDVHRAC